MPEIEYRSINKDIRNTSVAGLTIPMGITYIAASIRKYFPETNVEILDLYGEFYNIYLENLNNNEKIFELSLHEIKKRIYDFKPDFIGLSAIFSYQHNFAKDISHAIKNDNPAIKIYIGGYPTLAPEIVLEDISEVDGVFVGEAEKTIVEFLAADNKPEELRKIKGLCWRSDEKLIINKDHNLVSDINEIPLPAYDLLPLDKYLLHLGSYQFSLLTSRSCPFACSFCSSHLYSGRRHRLRNIEKVIEEIEYLKKIYKADFIWIRDDNFNSNIKHAKELLTQMIDKKINIPWLDTSGFHVNSIDEEFLDLVKASGCSEAIFAIESASPRVLKEIIRKNVNLDHARKMAKYCKKIGLRLQCYFVIGNPGETKDEIFSTIDFASEIQVDHCTFSIATPFPGTKYFDIAVEKGFLKNRKEDTLGFKYMEANMNTSEFDTEWLKNIQYDANIKVNFFENNLLKGDEESLRKALARFTAITKNYSFHAVAFMITGYLYFKLDDKFKAEEYFKKLNELLKDEKIANGYSKYIDLDYPAAVLFREWRKENN